MPSPEQREFAALLLRKAEGDVEVVRALVDNASIADDAIGFHAQQAIEKASAEFRYDDPPVPDELDRNASLRSAEQALSWARGVLAEGE